MRILRIAIRSLAASGALTLAAGCAGNGTTSPGEDSALLSGKTAQPLDATPQAVIDAVNAALPGATILEVELEDEDGRQVYDVEATDSEGVLYEVEVAADGSVLEIEKEDADEDEDDDEDGEDGDD
jgi:ABC-type glycerol-3-phosphate transport system substrate-binding protein